MEIVPQVFHFMLSALGAFFIYMCVMTFVDYLRGRRKDSRSLDAALSNQNNLAEKKLLDKQLELMDPWYPDHDRWLSPVDEVVLASSEIQLGHESYILRKLEMWESYQWRNARPNMGYPPTIGPRGGAGDSGAYEEERPTKTPRSITQEVEDVRS